MWLGVKSGLRRVVSNRDLHCSHTERGNKRKK